MLGPAGPSPQPGFPRMASALHIRLASPTGRRHRPACIRNPLYLHCLKWPIPGSATNCRQRKQPCCDRNADESTCGGDCSDDELGAHAAACPAPPPRGPGAGLQGVPRGTGRQPARAPGLGVGCRSLRPSGQHRSPRRGRTRGPPARAWHRLGAPARRAAAGRRCSRCCGPCLHRWDASTRWSISWPTSIPTPGNWCASAPSARKPGTRSR